MKILTVEDNEIIVKLMDRLMKELDFEVDHDTAFDGEEALEKSKEKVYNLVLMDINLGEDQVNGVELMKTLRQRNSYQNSSFFAITCYALPGDKERFLGEGFNEYLPKPLNYELLLDKIRDYKAKIL